MRWLLAAALVLWSCTASASWWNTSWTYRVPVSLSAPSSAQTNYLVEIMLSASQVPNYNWARLDADLRVLDQDNATALAFFVQPRSASTQVVRLWALIPSLPAATRTLYVYYGNASAASASNGATAFAHATAGVRLWTRVSSGATWSGQTSWYSSWNGNNDATAGYGCAVPATFQGQNNEGLFANGSGSSIAWNVTTIINVPGAQAGSWSLRWGPDLGYGGGLYLDDAPLQEAWGTNLWWGGSWGTASQLLQGSATLSAGYHVIRGIGGEDCCDGGQEMDALAPGGTWTPLGGGGFTLAGPSCQASIATPQTAQTVPNHYAIIAGASPVNCFPDPVQVFTHDSQHNLVVSTDPIALSTSTGHGDWSLGSGQGTFVAGAANSGAATYTFASADNGAALFFLRDTYPEAVTVGVANGTITATSGTATAAEDSPITFAPSGFIVTNGANTPTAIGTQIAGVTSTQSLALQAVRTDTKTGACTAVFASGTTVSVNLAYQCNNPLACVGGQTLSVTNNGVTTSIASNPNSGLSNYTAVPLKFSTTNAEAPIALNYTDAGQITLAARYVIPLGSGAASANTMTGAAQFVVQPYGLNLSNIKATSSGLANPGATTATGNVFIGAGQAFTATVTATNYQGSATPNFGQETTPTTVSLSPNLVLPAGGHDPALGGSFGAFAAGSATGTGFSWPEVGIITLTPGVAGYLGSGALVGTPSASVGRFVPNNFAVSLNTPLFGTACTAGGFTYLGQPFTYSVAPVATLTAQALGGATTQNYTGAFERLTNASLTGRTYTPTPASPALNVGGLPASSTDPAITDLGSGQVALTFGAGSGLAYNRASPIAPLNANIALSINVIDLDGVAAPNPVTFGGSSGIGFTAGAAQYYGRLTLKNALGSELLDLPVPMTTQYYLGTTQGFANNTADSCTVAPAIAFSNYQLNLKSGGTCVRDSGSPGISGAGCATAAGSRYAPIAAAGGFNLILAAPGGGNAGAVTVSATAPAWLAYPWTGSGSNSNPTSLATFGVFQGTPARIYQKEVY
jgi:hypothetical protein